MKRRNVIFAPEARHDLFQIYEWVAVATSPIVALDYIERIESWCLAFDLAGERGRKRDDIRPGIRITGFERRMTIAFTVTSEQVTILRLFYGGQDWESEFV
ncbi:type II toxin-antitoxin system RelE/ParE family toxin [Mesorhizobium sp. CGMCC 1.15528]|uniref:Type II toxin-antitoxin system RelE/ParE family toxin n=1 Tax=Mesorhizobium zhangyense TaxID=1776730 RepID=A0A7C9VBE2_9HYPH|nr:type II toxin-antitoxin system RelE/ParE family toxin [Mesorhizobium zhangyense]NGN41052.1 type II toxin-antitoxin system RelE/ParE family toxin [Mesorhizobium zhangyense]